MNQILYQLIGEAVHTVRRERGLTQADLADLAHLSRPSIVNIEKGRQSLSVHALYKIASGLNIDIKKILPDSKEFLLTNTSLPNSMKSNLTQEEQNWLVSKLTELAK
jgi:transcriptional regulator with XRE-family HTH domain